MKLKLILDIEGVGKIYVMKDNYVVFHKWQDEKKGNPYRPRYFTTLKGALLELKQYNLGKYLATQKEPATSFRELLRRLEEFENWWRKFLEENVSKIENQV